MGEIPPNMIFWDSTGYEEHMDYFRQKEMKWEQISMLIIRAPLLEVKQNQQVQTCRTSR